ncbi:hypothetical protein TSMEX_000489 [Taenia solium]|eukprot:TsM_001106200 transcript=TsM_001106200 gene=TsM_001106200
MAVTEVRTRRVRTWPTLTKDTELRGLPGLANRYRGFAKGFVKIASPPRRLTEKQTKKNFKSESEQDEALKELEQTLCSAQIRSGHGRQRLSFVWCTITATKKAYALTRVNRK